MFTAKPLSVIFLALGLSLSNLATQVAEARPVPQPSITARQSQTIAQRRRHKRFVPPKLKLDRGIPTAGRSHNASRGCQAQQGGPGLTLLVPEYGSTSTNSRGEEIESRYGMALSATAQPVFWAYVAVDEAAAEVSLEFVLRDAGGRKLYSEMLAMPERSGMVRIAPEGMPDLEAGVDYHWFLKQKSRCSGVIGLMRENGEAWVRYEPSSISEGDGETGSWHDALEAAAGDSAEFGELLEAIGLGELL